MQMAQTPIAKRTDLTPTTWVAKDGDAQGRMPDTLNNTGPSDVCLACRVDPRPNARDASACQAARLGHPHDVSTIVPWPELRTPGCVCCNNTNLPSTRATEGPNTPNVPMPPDTRRLGARPYGRAPHPPPSRGVACARTGAPTSGDGRRINTLRWSLNRLGAT